jgi:TetR/AcrR family transcriptional regulator, ethionamide resistance regulator
MGASDPLGARRARHDPADSEREILQAAESLLGERPFREVTVASIMLRTGLKRPAFYVHFRDLGDVLLRVAQRITAELESASQAWLAGPREPERDLLAALRGASTAYLANGALLRALADAAVVDARAETAYVGVVEGLVAMVAARLRAEQREGRVEAAIDAERTARALVWMNERYLYRQVVAGGGADVEEIVSVLGGIWLARLYGGGGGVAGAR